MSNIACYVCLKQIKQIKGEIRVVKKLELVTWIKEYKNADFKVGLPACQKCIKQVEKVKYS